MLSPIRGIRASRRPPPPADDVPRLMRELAAWLEDVDQTRPLQAVGRTGARYYEAGPRFPADVLDLARTPSPLVDPYGTRG